MLSLFLSLFAFAEPNVSVVYKTEDKIGFWMEEQSGNILYEEKYVYQVPYGYVVQQNNGYKNIHIHGGFFFTTTLPKDAIPISQAKGRDSVQGYRIEERKNKNGSIFYLHKKDGSKSVIGRGYKKLTLEKWLLFDTPKKEGFKKPNESFGWHKKAKKYLLERPDESTQLSYNRANKDDIADWNKKVQLFAPKTTITHGVWANLDLDQDLEGVACGIGVKFDACFVYDKTTEQWHHTELKWDEKTPPVLFQKNNGTYLAFRSDVKSKILRVLYYTGSFYETVFFRPEREHLKK